MIDPISAFGIAANIVQFIEVGYNVTLLFQQLLEASATDENIEIATIAEDMNDMCAKFASSSTAVPLSKDEKSLQVLSRKGEKLALELDGILKGLVVKSQGSARRIEVMQKALKALSKKKKVYALQTRLAQLRDEMVIRMVSVLEYGFLTYGKEFGLMCQRGCRDGQSDIRSKLQQLSDTGQKVGAETGRELRQAREEARRVFAGLGSQVLDMRAGVDTIATSQSEMKAVIDNLSRSALEAETSILILQSLLFPRMHDRRMLIHESYPKTFSWVFEASASPFRSWLEKGAGAFWVSGKAGSGKSTLMKFLVQSPQTDVVLRDWADGRELYVASFYFWVTGTRMQKSQEGLLQSILYKILSQEPSLIPVVLRDRWDRDAIFHHNPEPWSLVELYTALDRIISVKPKACFCFFIDGLDEFTGDANQHGQLAERIQKLAASPSVKICVASRPWIAFENVFGGDERRMLVLEHLTRNDMDKYVRGMLEENVRFTALLRKEPAASSLVHEIRDKAQGVFLWVTLVVKSLLSGLTQHDGLEELQHRLQTLPSDLRAFFARMLESIEDSYRIYASRILCLALCSTPLPLMTFWWIRIEVKDPEYAIRADVQEIGETSRWTQTARNFLNKWAKDLLAVYDSREIFDGASDAEDLKIDFLHRTVGDFLKEPEVYDQLRIQSGPDFDPDQSICRLLLAETKTMRQPEEATIFLRGFQAIACRMVSHAKQYEARHSRPLKTLLISLDSIITERLAAANIGSSKQHWTASIHTRHVANATLHREPVSNKSSNFLAYAVANDLVEFVRGALDTSPQEIHKPGRPLLDFALYPTFAQHDLEHVSGEHEYYVDMVGLLLERGSPPNQHADVIGVMSVWQLFLLDIHACEQDDRARPRAGAWKVAALLLRHKADPTVGVPVEKVTSSVLVQRSPIRDVTFHRSATRHASVEDCLSCVERHDRVCELLSSLPVSNVGFWSGWKPWFL
jgi:hypothetical protein